MTEQKDKDYELLKLQVDIWKTVVLTQQHFNDLEMRVRNYGVLILSAFIGAVGVAFKSGYEVTVFEHDVPVASILCFAASLIWLLFFFMDVYWYHPLLKGAVDHGRKIESAINDDLGGVIGLAKTVSDKSPGRILFWRNLHSKGKAKLFYLSVLFVLVACSISLFFSENKEEKKVEQEKTVIFTVVGEI